jgi:hypothetical protein
LDGAYVVGINTQTERCCGAGGEIQPAAVITSSPTVDDGVVYVGTSSKDENFTTTPTFRGSIMAVNAPPSPPSGQPCPARARTARPGPGPHRHHARPRQQTGRGINASTAG